jgi:hypothetical protein
MDFSATRCVMTGSLALDVRTPCRDHADELPTSGLLGGLCRPADNDLSSVPRRGPKACGVVLAVERPTRNKTSLARIVPNFWIDGPPSHAYSE